MSPRYNIDNQTRYNTDDLHEIVERVWGGYQLQLEGVTLGFAYPWQYSGTLRVRYYTPSRAMTRDFQEREGNPLGVKLTRNGDAGKQSLKVKNLGLVCPTDKMFSALPELEQLAAHSSNRVPASFLQQLVHRLERIRCEHGRLGQQPLGYPKMAFWAKPWMDEIGQGLQLRYSNKPVPKAVQAHREETAEIRASLMGAEDDLRHFEKTKKSWESRLRHDQQNLRQCLESIELAKIRIEKAKRELAEVMK